MIDELGVPSYAAFLGFLLYLPTRHDQDGNEFTDSYAEWKNIGFFILTSYFSYLNKSRI
jgi:hypothetical protein